MLDINLRQNKKITVLFAIVGGIASTLAVIVYIQRLRHSKEEARIRALDSEIKKLQLAQLQQNSD
jgi:hypothetical protein